MRAELLLAAAALLAAAQARAATTDEVHVLLPGGEAAQAIRAEADSSPPAPRAPFDLSLTVGSWAPNHLALDSRVPDATDFKQGTLPLLSAALVEAPFARGNSGTLSFRAGAGIETLTRTGTLSFPGGPQAGSQNAVLLPLEAGIEARPAFAQWRDVGVYLDATVNPMFLITERSPFDDGRSILGIGGGAVLGSTFNLRRLVSSDALYLDMNLVARIGELSGGNANGLGLQAGVRLEM
jgi:hypothetical protein